jgi:polar amino acid transport system substrate-binding protein
MCTAQAWVDATLERVKRRSVLNNVSVNTYPPFGFIDADNELAGFDVDVARALAAKLGETLNLATSLARRLIAEILSTNYAAAIAK